VEAILSTFVLILFFQKRVIWPRWFVALLLVALVGIIVDTILAQQIPAAAHHGEAAIKSVFQAAFASAIWIPYALVSQRVRATFRY
jgi:hypothetical protein